MKYLDKIICLIASFELSACSSISNWMQDEEAKATLQTNKQAHPVGITYDVLSSSGERKQISIFFSGKGKARLLDPADGNSKTLIDFAKQEITKKYFDDNTQETKALDPYKFPCILNADDAAKKKAICIGFGRTRGFAYHRWSLRDKQDEWEVWTDDNDSFPVYFRSIKAGEVCNWTTVNSWIDESTDDKPTFYTLDADPPPPEWLKAQEEEKERLKKEAEMEQEKEKTREHNKKQRTHSFHKKQLKNPDN